MGEYAHYRGQQIKIGTCEDLLYLRPDQVNAIDMSHDGDAQVLAHLDVFRFRFPWPDEDNREPGDFDDYSRGHAVNTRLPDVKHARVQLTCSRGFNLMLPCPLDPVSADLGYHFNGFAGPIRIKQQAVRFGKLVTLGECGGCGAMIRWDSLADVEPVLATLRTQADRCVQDDSRKAWLHTVADRITAGYVDPPRWLVAEPQPDLMPA